MCALDTVLYELWENKAIKPTESWSVAVKGMTVKIVGDVQLAVQVLNS